VESPAVVALDVREGGTEAGTAGDAELDVDRQREWNGGAETEARASTGDDEPPAARTRA
jgi:hypothetical protein